MGSESNPICWQDALLPLHYETESSCVLVMQQLSRDLTSDMNNRLVQMQMKCVKIDENDKYFRTIEIDKLKLFKPNKKEEGAIMR
tara:strand:+ start:925 stop:1179 length:255 start_codon:yes stop_codon:yes gene_type:complete